MNKANELTMSGLVRDCSHKESYEVADSSLPQEDRSYYGWWVVFAGFIIQFTSIGCIYYSWGNYLNPLAQEFGWSRGEISAGNFILMGTGSFMLWIIGGLVDKYGARRVITVSALVAGICCILFSFMSSLGQFYIISFFLGVSYLGIGSVPTLAAVSHWFRKRRGLAIGLTATGSGLGGFGMAPIVNYFIMELGVRHSFLVVAIILWCVIIPVAALIKKAPYENSLASSQAESKNPTNANGQRVKFDRSYSMVGMSLQQAWKTSEFWLLLGSALLFSIAMGGVVTHLVALLTDRGLRVQRAVWVLSSVSAASALGRVASGYLLDKFNGKYVFVGFNACMVVGVFLIFSGSEPVWVTLFPIIFGLALGAEGDILSYLVGTYFGFSHFALIFSFVFSAFTAGTGIGSLLMGYTFDRMGNYDLGLMALIVSVALSLLLVSQLRSPKSLTHV
jgi:MFS family permease